MGWFVVPRWGGVDEATRCWGGRVNRSVGSLRGIGLAAEVCGLASHLNHALQGPCVVTRFNRYRPGKRTIFQNSWEEDFYPGFTQNNCLMCRSFWERSQ